jgi:hypothetical protein
MNAEMEFYLWKHGTSHLVEVAIMAGAIKTKPYSLQLLNILLYHSICNEMETDFTS